MGFKEIYEKNLKKVGIEFEKEPFPKSSKNPKKQNSTLDAELNSHQAMIERTRSKAKDMGIML